MESSERTNKLPSHAEHASDDKDHSCPDAVDEGTADEGDDDIGEGVNRIQQIERKLLQLLVVFVLVVVLDVLLQSLGGEARTLGLSKQYSYTNITKIASTTTA